MPWREWPLLMWLWKSSWNLENLSRWGFQFTFACFRAACTAQHKQVTLHRDAHPYTSQYFIVHLRAHRSAPMSYLQSAWLRRRSSLVEFSTLSFLTKRKRKEKLRRQWKPLPTLIKEKDTLVPSTVKHLHREKERIYQWGSRVLQAWPETSSWWELV